LHSYLFVENSLFAGKRTFFEVDFIGKRTFLSVKIIGKRTFL
jgi:hypothetical protein